MRPVCWKDDCGLSPIRIDKEHHNEKICDKIIAEIRQCQFVVADFTMHKGGVYFEAGYAMGLGRPVIFTCRKDYLDSAHFDTRQYNHWFGKPRQSCEQRWPIEFE